MAQFTLPRNSKVTKGIHHPAKDGAQNTRTFTIYRWSPEDDENPRLDSFEIDVDECCLLYTSPSPRDLSTSRMPSSA